MKRRIRKIRPRLTWTRIVEPNVYGYVATVPILGIRIERIRSYPGTWNVFVRDASNGAWILTPMSGQDYPYHESGRQIRGYVDSLV